MFKKITTASLFGLQITMIFSLLLSLILLSIISSGPYLIIDWFCFVIALVVLASIDFLLFFYIKNPPIIFRFLIPLLNLIVGFCCLIPFTLPYILGAFAPSEAYAYAQLISSILCVSSSIMYLFFSGLLINILFYKDDFNVYKSIASFVKIILFVIYCLIVINVAASTSISLIAKKGVYLFNNYDAFYYCIILTASLWHYSFIFAVLDKRHLFVKKILFYVLQIIPLLCCSMVKMRIIDHNIPNWENNPLYLTYGWSLVILGIICLGYFITIFGYLVFRLIKNSYLIDRDNKL